MQLSPSTFGTGLEFAKNSHTLINRTGSTVNAGDVVQIDLTQSSSSTTGNTQGADTSLYAGAVTPYASGSPYVFYAIALETVADGRRFRATTSARMQVPVISLLANGSGDGVLVVRNGSTRLRVDMPGTSIADNVVGFNVGSTTSSATAQFVEVQFDGISVIPSSASVAGGSTTILSGGAAGTTWLRSSATSSIKPFQTATFDYEEIDVGANSSLTDVSTGGLQFEQVQTGTTINSASGRITSAAVTSGIMNPTFTTRILTGANIQNIGYWFGFVESTFMNVNNATSEHCAGFRYNTAATGNSTGFWTTVTCNGAGTETATVTTATIATSTQYELKVVYISTTPSVEFYINNVLVATHTTSIPATSAALLVESVVIARAAAAKRFAWSYARLQEGLLLS